MSRVPRVASALALIGIVILVASLLSGAIERSGLPQVGIFLLLGALVGPAGLGLVNLTLQSPTLQAIATLALVLVLFSDAIAMDMREVKLQRRFALLVLGPGTLIPTALIAVAGYLLLGLAPIQTVILGAALASTDPVLLRNLLWRPSLPPVARVALRLESGMNDVVLLPVVVLGILAAFAAGLVLAALDVELCDCFLDYGQATAEMFLLFTFVAFGAWLIWSGFSVADGRTILFALLALAARTVVLLPVLARAGVEARSRRLIAWFGPRGLSSLLLILLPVFAGMPGSVRMFEITCLVVLLSVLLHGAAIGVFLRKDEGPAAELEVRPAPAVNTAPAAASVAERITLDELRQLQSAGEPVVLADVRTERTYQLENVRAKGAVRLPPDDAVRRARELGLDHHCSVVLYCA